MKQQTWLVALAAEFIALLATPAVALGADSGPADTAKPVKVFILASQSNMEGKAANSLLDYQADAQTLTLSLRTRDPKTSELKTTPRKIDPHKAGIVIVDPWNYHWCMTWTEQAGGMTPRMNKALAGARKLGVSVFWGPTDSANMFSGWSQRQQALAGPYVPVPKVRQADCRWTVPYTGTCLCGPGIACVMNYGWDGISLAVQRADSVRQSPHRTGGR